MAAIIATQPKTCTHPCVRELQMAAAYLYHRLSNELYL